MSYLHSQGVKHLLFMAERELEDHGLADVNRLKLIAG